MLLRVLASGAKTTRDGMMPSVLHDCHAPTAMVLYEVSSFPATLDHFVPPTTRSPRQKD
ncbi:hypothetical protein PtrSN002B_012179 [Pyrenophora tritici-repentis]|nr:hypothetical protein PtrSN002B_012179 [Pyrenophora tritici-repentis]